MCSLSVSPQETVLKHLIDGGGILLMPAESKDPWHIESAIGLADEVSLPKMIRNLQRLPFMPAGNNNGLVMQYPLRTRDHVGQLIQTLLEMILPLLVSCCFAVAAIIIFSAPVWLLWNWVMPGIFGVRQISLLQALGLNLLAALLLRGRFRIETKK